MFWRWINGYSLEKIARSANSNPAKVSRALKKCVEKIDRFCYNRDRYLDTFGHLFDEMVRNARRVYPKTCFDEEWGLTHREVMLLKLWKVNGYNTKAIAKRMRLKENSVRMYKARINGKVGIDDIERQFTNDTGGDFDLSYSSELSGF